MSNYRLNPVKFFMSLLFSTPPLYMAHGDNGIVCASVSCNNTGAITIAGNSGIGIQTNLADTVILNSGSITTIGTSDIGIKVSSSGAGSTITNTGNISLTGNTSNAIHITAATVFNNASQLIASGAGSKAIYINYSGVASSTVNLNEDSVVVGAIENASSSAQGFLNIDLGSTKSYSYTMNGAWTITDLDQRPAAIQTNNDSSSTATAAGTGLQSLEPELLYERMALFNSVLAIHRSEIVTKSSGAPYDQTVWIQPYGAHYTRQEDQTDPLNIPFMRNIGGAALGFKLGVDSHLYAVASVDHSKLNIANQAQIDEANTARLGLFGPELYHVGKLTISPKFFIEYTQHKASRQVLVQTNPGFTTTEAQYNSYAGFLGTDFLYDWSLSKSTHLKFLLNLDLAAQNNAAYQESAYFSWDAHTFSQAAGNLELELSHTLSSEKTTFYARGSVSKRKLLTGRMSNYQINGLAASFNNSTTSDTYTGGHLGLRHASAPSIVTYADLGVSNSREKIKNITANIGLALGF